jgi:hypothetical protein
MVYSSALRVLVYASAIALVVGCSSAKFRMTSGPEFGGGFRNVSANREISLEVTYQGGSAGTWVQQIQADLGSALEDEGFVIVGDRVGKDGYGIKADGSLAVGIDGLTFLGYMITLGILPVKYNHNYTYAVTYYDGGRVVRRADYTLDKKVYMSVFSPIGFFVGTRDATANRIMYGALASDIAEDMPPPGTDAEAFD